MDYREEYDAEIDLKDLLFYILRRWRSMLLAALACCLLLGGYKAVRNLQLSPEDLVPQKIKDYEYKLAQYDLDKTGYEQDLKQYSELLEHQKEYLEKSVLMHIDPYCKPVAMADIFVKLDKEEWAFLPANLGLDPTDGILKIYTSGFSSTLDWEPIEGLTGNEKLYLEELLGISVDYNSNTFTVRVTYSDGQTAQDILDIILGQILDRQTEIESEAGRHTLSVSNRSLSYNIDGSLAESQRDNAATITGYERSILELRMEMEELEEPGRPFVIGFVKYPAAGFVLGIFLTAAFYGAVYLLSGRLHGEGSLRARYGYALLGILPHPQKNGFLSGVDRLLDRLADSPAEPEEEAYRRIALNLAGLAGERRRILLTGTVSLEKLQALAKAVSERLEGINLIAAADISQNADALEEMAGCDAVLLAETEGISRMSGIRKEYECIIALGKPVVGYVLL